jgi:hypothetical protein
MSLSHPPSFLSVYSPRTHRGPKPTFGPSFKYEGNMWQELCLIAGGTGITPMWQVGVVVVDVLVVDVCVCVYVCVCECVRM